MTISSGFINMICRLHGAFRHIFQVPADCGLNPKTGPRWVTGHVAYDVVPKPEYLPLSQINHHYQYQQAWPDRSIASPSAFLTYHDVSVLEEGLPASEWRRPKPYEHRNQASHGRTMRSISAQREYRGSNKEARAHNTLPYSSVGCQLSTHTEAPRLSPLALPVATPRSFKIKLPLERGLDASGDTKRSWWSRYPISSERAAHCDVSECDARCKSPHPEEIFGKNELPDTLDVRCSIVSLIRLLTNTQKIYLPNDWRALRHSLSRGNLAHVRPDQLLGIQ